MVVTSMDSAPRLPQMVPPMIEMTGAFAIYMDSSPFITYR